MNHCRQFIRLCANRWRAVPDHHRRWHLQRGVRQGQDRRAGGSTAAAANLRSMESLWRLGIAGEMVMVICTVALTLVLYVLLRPVSRDLVYYIITPTGPVLWKASLEGGAPASSWPFYCAPVSFAWKIPITFPHADKVIACVHSQDSNRRNCQ